MTEKTEKLSWGLQPPPGASVAWGARAIFKDGGVDLLHDRQGMVGDKGAKESLAEALNGGPLGAAREQAYTLWSQGKIRGDVAGMVTLVDDGQVVIEADTRGSYGYLYMVAYLRTECQNQTA
jgi:hypothetical protein